MAYENLKTAIKQAIKQNGNQEITGDLLQSTLLNIVDELSNETHVGYDVYSGIISPITTTFSYNASTSEITVRIANKFINAFRTNGAKVLSSVVGPEDTSTFKIQRYYALVINLKTKQIEIGSIDGTADKDYIVLLQNEGENTTQGVLAPLFREYYYKNFVQPKETHFGFDVYSGIISPITTTFSYNASTSEITVRIANKFINAFRTNGAKVLSSVVGPEDTSTFKIQRYYALVINLKTKQIEIGSIDGTADKDYIVLLQNEGENTTQGVLAPLFREYYYKNFVRKSRFLNKKVVFFGDSITAQDRYVSRFANITGCIAINRGVSGSTVTLSPISQRVDSLCERVDLPKDASQGIPDADCIIVFAGINDWGQRTTWNIKLNKNNIYKAIDKTCFTGAFRYVLQKLRTTHPNSEIIVLGLHHVYSTSDFSKWSEIRYLEDNNGAYEYITDEEGNNLQDWRDVQKEVCNFYGIQFVDMTSCGFTPFIESDYAAFTDDGLHPNSAGANMFVNNILKQIDYSL